MEWLNGRRFFLVSDRGVATTDSRVATRNAGESANRKREPMLNLMLGPNEAGTVSVPVTMTVRGNYGLTEASGCGASGASSPCSGTFSAG